MAQLADAIDTLETWERGVALIVQGEGGHFCAGADLSLAREHLVTAKDGRLMCALMTDTLTRLRRYVCVDEVLIKTLDFSMQTLLYNAFSCCVGTKPFIRSLPPNHPTSYAERGMRRAELRRAEQFRAPISTAMISH